MGPVCKFRFFFLTFFFKFIAGSCKHICLQLMPLMNIVDTQIHFVFTHSFFPSLTGCIS